MSGDLFGEGLEEKLGEHFVTRHERTDGILFRGPDPRRRGRVLRLLITFEAWEDCEPDLPAAVDRAIQILEGNGGYVVIRENRGHELVVVPGSELGARSPASR